MNSSPSMSATCTDPSPEPISVRVRTAVQLTGISRSRIYELIAAGEIETVKIGRSTLIPYHCLKRLVGQA